MTVLFLDQPECQEAGTVGGKGASLARMASLGVAVPPAFVVSADALVAALPDGGEELRRIVAAAEDHRLDAVAERARRIVLAAETSPALREQIAAAHRRLGDGEPSVAVRSSACAEDSEAASFAGQQETYLHVRGEEQVVSRIRDCWASFFSERALFYRSRKGSLEDLGIAVVIQRMVDPAHGAGGQQGHARRGAAARARPDRRPAGAAPRRSPGHRVGARGRADLRPAVAAGHRMSDLLESARAWIAYVRWHQDRCADIVAGWLRDQGVDEAMLREVEALVRAHEDGGWPEVDLIQAADSLSFLEDAVAAEVAEP